MPFIKQHLERSFTGPQAAFVRRPFGAITESIGNLPDASIRAHARRGAASRQPARRDPCPADLDRWGRLGKFLSF